MAVTLRDFLNELYELYALSFMHPESARAYPIGRRSEGLDDVGQTLSLCAFPVALYAAVGLAVVGDVEFCCPKSPKKCSEHEKWEEIRVIRTTKFHHKISSTGLERLLPWQGVQKKQDEG